jgi:hypothetical protein
LAEVWWCLAPTERAYLKQKINTRIFKGLDNRRVEKWKILAWKMLVIKISKIKGALVISKKKILTQKLRKCQLIKFSPK